MKPILFNTEMVQAILDSRKTTTRRIIKVNNSLEFMGFKEGKALLGKGCCIHETIKARIIGQQSMFIKQGIPKEKEYQWLENRKKTWAFGNQAFICQKM
ncbi:MAG: hypothetical protein E6980_21460 [Clostridium sp.]|uniref:hypothetical protein n=1 Tax=Clostridium sp. TaxID=1506 RepID=UPI0029047BC3|nr:hypothetical protein [Clostridium sp.]MDU1232703.1 hypothetical protein [Clostridium sp.]